MRTVITVSLNGTAYQLESGAYESLDDYLKLAAQRLTGNPDRTEVLADLEQAIAEKCGPCLGAHKNVVTVDEMAAILEEMGPVEPGVAAGEAGASTAGAAGAAPGDAAGDADGIGARSREGAAAGMDAGPGAGTGTGANTARGGGATPRRFFRLHEGEVIAGVCTGIAASLGWEVALVRLAFILLAMLTGGLGILVYWALVLLIPYAETPEEQAAARGRPFTAEEVISRARAQYEGLRGRDWRRQWREQRRAWRQQRRHWRWQQRTWAHWGRPAWGAAPWGPAGYRPSVMEGALAPVFGLLSAVLFFVFLWALLTIIRRHAVLGLPLPADMPAWLGIVILCVFYGIVASPLHHARHAFYHGAFYTHPAAALWGAVVWTVLLAVGGWYAWQHWPEVQTLLQQLSQAVHGLLQPQATGV